MKTNVSYRLRATGAALLAAVSVAGCGGGNPLDNPPLVDNPLATGGRKLSFAYFQRCVQPVLLSPLSTSGPAGPATCASAGCHDDTSGTGGALRVRAAAEPVDLANAALTVEAIRATDMYRNFYSSQGETLPGQPMVSRLLAKPLLLNVLHGGGLVFESTDDERVRRIAFWISRPMPAGQDEFSTAGNAMFEPADAMTGACRVE